MKSFNCQLNEHLSLRKITTIEQNNTDNDSFFMSFSFVQSTRNTFTDRKWIFQANYRENDCFLMWCLIVRFIANICFNQNTTLESNFYENCIFLMQYLIIWSTKDIDHWRTKTVEENLNKKFSFLMWYSIIWSIQDTCFIENKSSWIILSWWTFISNVIFNSYNNHRYVLQQSNDTRTKSCLELFISKMILKNIIDLKCFLWRMKSKSITLFCKSFTENTLCN